MSHFSNVEAMLCALEESDPDRIAKFLDFWDENELEDYDDLLEEAARSILYLLVTFRAGMHKEAWKEWRDKVSANVVEEEIHDMFWEEDDED